MKDAFGGSEESYFRKVVAYDILCTPSSEHGLNSSNVQEIIHSKKLQFDLVINEDMFHESWLMFAHKFHAPIVTICTEHLMNFFLSKLNSQSCVNHSQAPMGTPTFSTVQWGC